MTLTKASDQSKEENAKNENSKRVSQTDDLLHTSRTVRHIHLYMTLYRSNAPISISRVSFREFCLFSTKKKRKSVAPYLVTAFPFLIFDALEDYKIISTVKFKFAVIIK